jgi:hypothetical protein
MSRTLNIRKSVVLLASVAALVAPTAATAYPVIGDDPSTAAEQAQGHDWYRTYEKRLANRVKPSNVKPSNILCPPSKSLPICRRP